MHLNLDHCLAPPGPLGDLVDRQFLEVHQRQDESVSRPQLRQQGVHHFRGLARRPGFLGIGLQELIPVLQGRLALAAALLLLPPAVSHPRGDAIQPVGKRRLGLETLQGDIGLNKHVVDQFFKLSPVARKSPHSCGYFVLIPVNQAGVSFAVASQRCSYVPEIFLVLVRLIHGATMRPIDTAVHCKNIRPYRRFADRLERVIL